MVEATTDSPPSSSVAPGTVRAVAGGRNKATTPLPAWMTEANRARREEQLGRRPTRQVHCWVLTSAGECPGLVLDWRREGAGWAALAVWTTGTATFVHAWVDAEQVRPAVVAGPQ